MFEFGAGELGVLLEGPRGLWGSGEPSGSESPWRTGGGAREWSGHLGEHSMRRVSEHGSSHEGPRMPVSVLASFLERVAQP